MIKNKYLEEISDYVDGECCKEKKQIIKNLILSDSNFAHEYHVQKCMKELLSKRFCTCAAPTNLSQKLKTELIAICNCKRN